MTQSNGHKISRNEMIAKAAAIRMSREILEGSRENVTSLAGRIGEVMATTRELSSQQSESQVNEIRQHLEELSVLRDELQQQLDNARESTNVNERILAALTALTKTVTAIAKRPEAPPVVHVDAPAEPKLSKATIKHSDGTTSFIELKP